MDAGIQENQAQGPALTLTSSVFLGKILEITQLYMSVKWG